MTKPEKEKMIKFCPRCGSGKVVKQIYGSAAGGVSQPWKCEECRFQSDIFPEVYEEKLKLIQKEIKKEKIKK